MYLPDSQDKYRTQCRSSYIMAGTMVCLVLMSAIDVFDATAGVSSHHNCGYGQ